MARPKGEINLERCKRLKLILDQTETKQIWLHNKTGISQQAISKMIKGQANVTETTAKLVTELFPQYSFEWLMGLTDYKNQSERFGAVISDMQNESDLLMRGLAAFAKLCDYQISAASPVRTDPAPVGEVLKAIREGYTIRKDDRTVRLSLEEMNDFENEVCDFVELKLKHLFKQKGERDNG